MSYTHFTTTKRAQIEILRREGYSLRAIALRLNRSPSSISREIKRNAHARGYSAQYAQQRYLHRRQACRPAKKLHHLPLWNYVLDKLRLFWSPETIAGRLRRDYPHDPCMQISHETLYQAIYTEPRLRPFISYLRQKRPKRRKHSMGKTSRGCIPNRLSIR